MRTEAGSTKPNRIGSAQASVAKSPLRPAEQREHADGEHRRNGDQRNDQRRN
jgi:hypothetical protein